MTVTITVDLTRKLEKAFNLANALEKTYGARMAVLKAARSLVLVPATPPDRRHRPSGHRNEQFAVDLVQPYRLVFEGNHEPVPRRDDDGIDKERVTAITILDVVDHH